jgi:Cu(I)/Ag(I) efflux system membrane fusion protein
MKKRSFVIAGCLILTVGFFFARDRFTDPLEAPAAVYAGQEMDSHSHHTHGHTAPPGSPEGGAAKKASRGVEIPAERQQLIGVKIVEVVLVPLEKEIRTVGRIEYDESKLATVNLKVEGWIEKLHVNSTGSHVKKGEPLAEIYSPEFLAVQLEYLNLLQWRKERAYRFQRELEFTWGDRYGTTGRMQTGDLDPLIQVAQQRLNLWEIPDELIREIEKKNEAKRTFTLKSPVTGYVVQKPAILGKRFEPGEKLFDIVDLSGVWVIADIYAHELPLVKVGQSAKISVSFFPGKEFSAEIDYIYPFLAAETRTAKVRFIVPNPGEHLKPEMFTKVEIRIGLGKRLVIPEDAFIDTGTKQLVYVDKGDGYFEPREVKLGMRAQGLAEVIEGLKAGEKIAGSANFLIDSEAKLKGVTQ